ncbi:SDR family NAD(P)-dependent oxidoreductase [Xenorhabdus bovienii]|uniref:SDR family NAD(P)-dependent oxidoreductase n=1 Tax=Xenorhabdus bovienii TaxID=40576 RepID=UPI00237CED0B|nr:SDR family NAD(P)-dependent oxidoreductase [Xenorhabdus bovienii]MDE1485701.1 SDR family NAD(P)-dependent oxidoreductase [Xenorhabdus bovienii]MDE9476455.1 SDR family NAD(P)-dependent oxidoreductase [Xenorhabdus bovienii]MDE9529298.1 SDR family NAD(P)-dependent oxidoreductase [Xenorhabdus bovienii]
MLQGDTVHSELTRIVAEIVDIEPEQLDLDTGLGQIGFNSLHYALLAAQLSDMLHKDISPTQLFDLPTLNKLADYVTRHQASARPNETPSHETVTPSLLSEETGSDDTALAIIGIHCRMPQADDLNAFWQNILAGRECIEPIPASRWDWRRYYDIPNGAPNTTYAYEGGFIRGFDQFDAEFFRLTPREVDVMDPRHRLALQGVWHTLEDAGYRPKDLRGEDIGVFIGASGDEYANLLIQAGHQVDSYTLTGTGRAFLSNRISYWFDWHGPSEVIDTTCSSSLVALNSAHRAILDGTCRSAIVGGMSILMDPWPQIALSQVNVLAEDNRCKTFDSRANGYVRSEGVGMIMVKRLAQAQQDGDFIYAVIKGSAVNHGGQASAMTAPRTSAQASLSGQTWETYQADVRGLGYIETHGTGTQLGDPIEIEGIKQALEEITTRQGVTLTAESIVLGSVKANIGHCEAAAGMAGLLKVVMCLRERIRPPMAGLQQVNERIDLAGTALTLNRQPLPWPSPQEASIRRMATVSAFGFGGVNAYVIVEEYPQPALPQLNAPLVLPLSARDDERLDQYVIQLMNWLTQQPEAHVPHALFTYQSARENFTVRQVFMADSVSGLLTAMRTFINDKRVGQAKTAGYGNNTQLSAWQQASITDWLQGKEVDWSGLYQRERPQRLPVPGYPFNTQRYWPEVLRNSRYGKLDGELQQVAADCWQINLTHDQPFIRDHCVNDVTILPAAASVMLLEQLASKHLSLRGLLQIHALTWLTPVQLDEAMPLRLSFQVTAVSDTRWQVECSFQRGEQKHFSATLESEKFTASIDGLHQGAQHFTQSLTAEECYHRLSQLGLSFGASLRPLQKIWLTADEALSELKLPEREMPYLDPVLPVAMLDGMLQTALLHYASQSDMLSVPFSIATIKILAPLPENLFVRVRQHQRMGSSLISYSLTAFSPAGTPLLVMEGAVGRPLMNQMSAPATSTVTRFAQRWQVQPDALPQTDYPVLNLYQEGDEETENLFQSGSGWPLSLTEADDQSWMNVLQTLSAAEGKRVMNIILGRQNRSLESVTVWLERLYFLLQGLVKARLSGKVIINLIWFNDPQNATSSLLTGLDGFAKGVSHEFPRYSVNTLEVCGVHGEISEFHRRQIEQRLRQISALGGATSCRLDLLSGLLLTRDLTPLAAHPLSSIVQVRPSGVYVVSGGAGRIGLFFANYLLARGAKVLLLGRTAADSVLPELRFALPESGWEYRSVDVIEADAVQRALADARTRYSTINGVVHCAGLPPTSLLINKTVEGYRAIVDGKLKGIYHLDAATLHDSLDFFVACSSLVALTGHSGGTDYALANRSVEGFIEQRQKLWRQGQRNGHSVAIGWPAWAGGMVIDESELAFIRRKGFVPLDDQQATELVTAALLPDAEEIQLIACGDPVLYHPFIRSLTLPALLPDLSMSA